MGTIGSPCPCEASSPLGLPRPRVETSAEHLNVSDRVDNNHWRVCDLYTPHLTDILTDTTVIIYISAEPPPSRMTVRSCFHT